MEYRVMFALEAGRGEGFDASSRKRATVPNQSPN
ncbi:hypothetical protein V1288_000437 [Bradyrhizobium sp. AZCC 2176]